MTGGWVAPVTPVGYTFAVRDVHGDGPPFVLVTDPDGREWEVGLTYDQRATVDPLGHSDLLREDVVQTAKRMLGWRP